MASYQVLDIQLALHYFSDEENMQMMIKMFAMDCFSQRLQDYHRDLIAMDFKKLKVRDDDLRGVFNFLTSPEMISLISVDMRNAIYAGDEEKLILLHLIFLRKCSILHRELEDYLQAPVPSPDIKEYVNECLKKLNKEDKVQEIEGEARGSVFCAGCSIF